MKTVKEMLIEIGGVEWKKSEELDRVYLKDVAKNTEYVKDKNEKDFSNSRWTVFTASINSLYYDVAKGEFTTKIYSGNGRISTYEADYIFANAIIDEIKKMVGME